MGDDTFALGRGRDRRSPNPAPHRTPRKPIRAAAPPGLLGAPRAVRPGTIYASTSRRPPPLRLLSLRRRASTVHRPEPGDARNARDPGHDGPGVRAPLGAGAPCRARRADHVAPACWPIDDTAAPPHLPFLIRLA